MKTSMRGLIMIAHHEAIVLSRYKDSKGIWTIGVGFTHAALAGTPYDPEHFTGKMTIEGVIETFKFVLKRYEADVMSVLTREPTQEEFDAMVSFHWNTGAIKKASFVKLWNRGAPKAEIAKAFMMWNKPPEIIHRRRLTCHLLTDGDYGPAAVYTYNADAAGHIDWHHPKVIPETTMLALLKTPEKAVV